MSGCAEYCLRVVGLLWAVLGVPGAPSGRVWPVGSGGVASRGCIHTSKIVSRKVHPSLTEKPPVAYLGIAAVSAVRAVFRHRYRLPVSYKYCCFGER